MVYFTFSPSMILGKLNLYQLFFAKYTGFVICKCLFLKACDGYHIARVLNSMFSVSYNYLWMIIFCLLLD
jgi:hypothetical protein